VVITRLNICVMEENKRDEKQAEKYSKDDKEINDYDNKHKADFEEETSGED
jgi:hypothetical protein